MTDDHTPPTIKITDRRSFDSTGERRKEAVESGEGAPTVGEPAAPPSAPPKSASSQGQASGARAPQDLSEIAMRLSSSFSLLVARLAQEIEIYLGLAPFPGKETPEPDLEAARAMIDMLSMLQEKTRGNLDAEESALLENLLYTYRMEFVRSKSGGPTP